MSSRLGSSAAGVIATSGDDLAAEEVEVGSVVAVMAVFGPSPKAPKAEANMDDPLDRVEARERGEVGDGAAEPRCEALSDGVEAGGAP